jgi:predicted RNase H-like nuclease
VELQDGAVVETCLLRPIEAPFEELADAEIVAIDVPIGFGPRDADGLAREFLRGAASTVFTTPSRRLLETPFAPGLGISAQAHALGPRIIHVTSLAESDARFHEVHPELSFRAMNGGEPLRYRKKTAGGVYERLELLRLHGMKLDDLGDAAIAPIDDVLDAAAAAWSAYRIASGEAVSLPDPPELKDGLRVAIWY